MEAAILRSGLLLRATLAECGAGNFDDNLEGANAALRGVMNYLLQSLTFISARGITRKFCAASSRAG